MYKNGNGDEGRDLCFRGSWQVAQAITQAFPLGGSHAIGHLLGSVAGVPHGYTSCVLLPAVMKYNYEVNAVEQENFMKCFRTNNIFADLGLAEKPDLRTWDVLSKLIVSLAMPQTLEDVKLPKEKWEAVAEGTLSDLWPQTNPIPLVKRNKC